jgi:hypothetical protein
MNEVRETERECMTVVGECGASEWDERVSGLM